MLGQPHDLNHRLLRLRSFMGVVGNSRRPKCCHCCKCASQAAMAAGQDGGGLGLPHAFETAESEKAPISSQSDT
jgi:hypothetical protein